MNKIIAVIPLLIIGFNTQAQSICDCKAEMDFVYEQMQTMSSYKSQIKGELEDKFETTYQTIRERVSNDMNITACYVQMNELMSLVRDKHAGAYGTRPDYGVEEALDSSFVASYRVTEAFLAFPKVDLSIDSLRQVLSMKATADVEGIYNFGNAMKLGIYRIDQTDSLVGVILDSKIGVWEPGQIYAYIKNTGKANYYNMVVYGQIHKNLLYYRNHFIRNGILSGNVMKENLAENHIHVNADLRKEYTLHTLENDVQYIWLNSFSRFGNVEKRDALVKQIEEELDAKSLIVDLRNNGGGASKISVPILRAIKKSGAKVYVLTNYSSGSNAEQTTIRFRNIKSTVHLGERTYGAVAYGHNYGNTFTSPSGLFYFAPTDMKFNHFLKYEEVGVEPHIELDPNRDWIEQTLELIQTKKL